VAITTVPAVIVGKTVNEALTLNYEDTTRPIEEGQLYVYNAGEKLSVTFLPLEHTTTKSRYRERNLEVFAPSISHAIFDPNLDEVWLEARKSELDNITSKYPSIFRRIGEFAKSLTIADNAALMYGYLEEMINTRPEKGLKPVDLLCADIVGGSPWFVLLSNKMGGGISTLFGINSFAAYDSFKGQLNFIRKYLTTEHVSRREFLKILGRAGIMGIYLPQVLSFYHHHRQMETNTATTRYVTEDTFREGWLAWEIQEYARLLSKTPDIDKKNILVINTPPHIQGVVQRLLKPVEHQEEMRVYFNTTPSEIWEQGIRRYEYQEDASYKLVDFSLYPPRS
jgi:hypothetical protein